MQELFDMYYAYIEQEKFRQESHRAVVAWQTVHLLNISGKSVKTPVSVDDLIDNKKEAPPVMTEEERKKALEDLKLKFN